MAEPSKEALEAVPENGRDWVKTDLGKAFQRFESALGTAWCTDQRESATTASMRRDWGRADEARDAFMRELRLALDRFRVEGVEAAWKEATIAWAVCASIHREYAKGRDALYTTRQADFVKHETDCRAKLGDQP